MMGQRFNDDQARTDLPILARTLRPLGPWETRQVNRVITAMTVTDDGWICFGGDFMNVWGVQLPRLARLHPEDIRKPYIVGPYFQGDDVRIALDTHDGWTHSAERAADLSGDWIAASHFHGTGERTILKDPLGHWPHRSYRVRAER